jgi:hypothetical protein
MLLPTANGEIRGNSKGGRMKRTALLLVTIFFCSAIFLFAGDNNQNNAKEMIGWVCNAKCVDQNSGRATCNKNCSEAAGNVVFIDEQGQVLQISNQDTARPMAGKKCKMTAKQDPATGALAVENMVEYAGP